ncbi:polysaccharide lyase [Maribacter sp. 2-571]|uniref:polysaccharide lyase n=1 Tax=Maribacter sp. 2-571 TaxID=3417569 RepID=UPI003D32DA36
MKKIGYFCSIVLLCSCKPNKAVLSLSFDAQTPTPQEKVLLNDPRIDLSPASGTIPSNCIQVNYVGDGSGSKRIVHSMDVKEPLMEATLRYRVKFDTGFKFVRGGKLHGMGPKNRVTGGHPIRPGGWSARIMFKDSGKVAPYLYHQKMKGKYGEGSTTEKPMFTPGIWHQVALYTKVNRPANKANGVFEVWINNTRISKTDSIQFRGVAGDSTLINQLLFSTFHGGNDPSWAPKDAFGSYTNEKAWFDDIELYKGRFVTSKN